MAQTKGEGKGVAEFATGTLISRHNLLAVLVDTGGDLQSEDDAPFEAVERALQFIQPLAFFAVNDNSGVIHCVVDGSQFDASALQAQIRAIGSVTDPTTYDFSSAAVTAGSSFTVA